ncbi:hypothetical protein Hanom_Chr15g01358001 [Helianthus anomalus]
MLLFLPRKIRRDIRIGGAVIGVNLAKYDRHGSKIETSHSGERGSVFSKLQYPDKIQKPGRAAGRTVNAGPGYISYSSVVKAPSSGSHAPNLGLKALPIEIPPTNTVTKKSLEFRSLVEEVKDIDTLNNLKVHLTGVTDEGLRLNYLGSLKVLLCFSIPPIFERITWIKILGVPISLWDWHIFNKIGERCGRLLVKSEAEASNGNMSEERVAVLVQTAKKLSLEFNLSWKDHKINVWVEEISGQWYPNFLDES